MQVLLEQLSTIGDVTVTRGMAPIGFSNGFTWTITFETQIGNVERLSVDGNATAIPIIGPDAHLTVVEVQSGLPPSLNLDVNGLEPGSTYFARASAKNSAGFGATTLASAADGGDRGSNNDGLGISPLAVITQTAPDAPSISHVTAVSASQLEVTLKSGNSTSGTGAIGYKVCIPTFLASCRHFAPRGLRFPLRFSLWTTLRTNAERVLQRAI